MVERKCIVMKELVAITIMATFATLLLSTGIGRVSVSDSNYIREFGGNLIAYGASGDVINPSALYYNGKTYIVVDTDSGSTENAYVLYYDHNTKTFSNPYFAMLSDWPNGDSHGIPTICRDNSGYLHVFNGVGWATKACYHAKSTNPDDITSWQARQQLLPPGNYEFPHPIVRGNSEMWVWYLDFEGDCKNGYIKSTDGNMWSGYTPTFDYIGYDKQAWIGKIDYTSTPERVHFAWTDYINSTKSREILYYAYYSFADGHMHNAAGTDLGVKIDNTEANNYCLIYRTVAGTASREAHVHADSSGVPYVIFNNNGDFKFTRWTGSEWTELQTVTSTTAGNYSDTHDFIVHSSTNIEAYFQCFTATPAQSRIEKWNWDGSNWTEEADLLVGERPVGPCVVQNCNDDMKIIISQDTGTSGNKAFGIGIYRGPTPAPTRPPPPPPPVVNDNTTGTGNNQFNYSGTWDYYLPAGAYMSDSHHSNTTNNYYTVAFNGTQVKVHATKVHDAGIAACSIDGGPETKVDCYSATERYKVLVYTSPVLTAGQHTLKVRVTGTKNVGADGYVVYADKVEIFNGGEATRTATPIPAATATPMATPALIKDNNTTGTGNNQFNPKYARVETKGV
jgi:hypothetical protein